LLEQTRLTLLALDRPAEAATCLKEHRDCGSQFVGPTAHALVQAGVADPHFLGAMTSACGIAFASNRTSLNVSVAKSKYATCMASKGSALTDSLHVWARGYGSNESWAANYTDRTEVRNALR